MTAYVSDGYELQGCVAPAVPESSGERLHDGLEFTYRPATRLETVRLDAELAIDLKNKDFDPECAINAEKRVCKFVADRIKSWNLKNAKTHAVPVSAETCERMHPFLFGSVYRIIRGVQASDKKPEADKSPVTDAEQLKNSEAA
jgi:hypothetical protein